MDEQRRLAMRRAHTKHSDHCSCGMIVHGNGGRAAHRHMHERRGDGHHAVLWYVWPFMFPEHDGRTPRAPTLTFEMAVAAEVDHRAENARQRKSLSASG